MPWVSQVGSADVLVAVAHPLRSVVSGDFSPGFAGAFPGTTCHSRSGSLPERPMVSPLAIKKVSY